MQGEGVGTRLVLGVSGGAPVLELFMAPIGEPARASRSDDGPIQSALRVSCSVVRSAGLQLSCILTNHHDRTPSRPTDCEFSFALSIS